MEKDWIITIQALLKGRNAEFDKSNKDKVRLVRHKDNRKSKIIDGESYEDSLYNLYLYKKSIFLEYQSEQYEKDFKDVDYIVSFIGEESTDSRFIGVFKNNGIKNGGGHGKNELVKFNFVPLSGFEMLENKVIVEWASPLSWRQHYNKLKPVICISRDFYGKDIPVFTRYEDVMLNYKQLKAIISSRHPIWKSKLESCNCIYLILDKKEGKRYIGSTYRDKNIRAGIWSRWSQYAKNGHGGDVLLQKLIKKDPLYADKYFQWCILETMPITVTPSQAVEREKIWKLKIGTKNPMGYNLN